MNRQSSIVAWLRPLFRKSAFVSCTLSDNREHISTIVLTSAPGINPQSNDCQATGRASRDLRTGRLQISLPIARSRRSSFLPFNIASLSGIPNGFRISRCRPLRDHEGIRQYWYSPTGSANQPPPGAGGSHQAWTAGQDVEVFWNSYWCAACPSHSRAHPHASCQTTLLKLMWRLSPHPSGSALT